MASSYPGGLDSFTNPAGSDPLNTAGAKLHSKQHGDANDAIEAIQATLGIDPQGAESTVADRLDAIEAGGGGGGGGGLVLVDSGTFSGVSAVNVDSVFDGTYDDYRIAFRYRGSTDVAASLRLRATSTDSSASYDATRGIYYSNTGAAQTNNLGTDEVALPNCGSAQPAAGHLDVFSPHLSEVTLFDGVGTFWFSTTGRGLWWAGGVHGVASPYDGFSILAGAGTITGRWAVYGYAK